MAAPSFISITQTASPSWGDSNTPKTTASIAVQNGDILVAACMDATANSSQAYSVSTASGSTSSWTPQGSRPASKNSQQADLFLWTATATANGNITVSFTRTAGNASEYGGLVKVWRGSAGIGNVALNDNGTGSGSPTVSVTTTGNNSGLDFFNVDWSAVQGTVTFTASHGTPVSDFSEQSYTTVACYYAGHVLDASTAGSKTFGMSAPTGQRYTDGVVEILGSGAVNLSATNISAAAPTIGAPALAVLGSVTLSDYALDYGLNALDSLCDRIYLCNAEPTTFAQVGTMALGYKNFGTGNAFGSISAGSPSGRKTSSVAITDGDVQTSGTATHWAAVDFADSQLLATGALNSSLVLESGAKFTLDSFTVHTFG